MLDCLFVCLFGVYRPTLEFSTHMETSPLPIITWPLISEGSLACNTGLLLLTRIIQFVCKHCRSYETTYFEK